MLQRGADFGVTGRGFGGAGGVSPSPVNYGLTLGKCCKLPQQGLGGAPAEYRFWCILSLNKTDLVLLWGLGLCGYAFMRTRTEGTKNETL